MQPETLFHYTSSEAARSILLSRTMWATDYRFMNDPQEVMQGLKWVQEICIKLKNELENKYPEFSSENMDKRDKFIYSGECIQGSAIEDYCRYLFVEHAESIGRFPGSIGIISFSENDDSLPQWRAYCPQGGLALGFKFDTLMNIVNQLGSYNNVLIQCQYGSKEELFEIVKNNLYSFLDRQVKEVVPMIRGDYEQGFDFKGINWKPIFKGRFYEWFGEFRRIASQVKHGSFKEEEEWRILIEYHPNYKKIRTRNEVIIPYSVFNLNKRRPTEGIEYSESQDYRQWLKDVFNQITIGPYINKELVKTGLEVLLDYDSDGQNTSVPIRETASPYRVF